MVLQGHLRDAGGRTSNKNYVTIGGIVESDLRMNWLNKILGRDQANDRDTWLAAHPDKRSLGAPPPAMSAEEEGQTRATMERELDAQRTARKQE